MRRFFCVFALMVGCALVASSGGAQDKQDKDKKVADKKEVDKKVTDKKVTDKKEEKKSVGALAPHKLDRVFENVRTPTDVTNTLINEPLYKQAVLNALKAKQEAEIMRGTQPNLAGPSPAQAAREAFLKTLKDGQEHADPKKLK